MGRRLSAGRWVGLAASIILSTGGMAQAGASLVAPDASSRWVNDALSRLPPEVREAVEHRNGAVAALRRAMSGGRFEERIRSFLPGQPAGSYTLPVPSSSDLSRVRSLPAKERPAVAGLLAVVRQTLALMERTSDPEGPAAEVSSGPGWVYSVEERISGASRGGVFPAFGRDPAARPVRSGRSPRVSERAAAAAMLIGAALDRYLPTIESEGSARPLVQAANGCDQLDLVPLLCVSSAMSTAHTEDAVLTIDQGGDDTYTNSAGGAPFTPDGGTTFYPVSVSVDLGGNDRYVAGPLGRPQPGPATGLVAQGAEAGQAIGILVDLSGDDTYSATLDSDAPDAFLSAQGASGGAYQANRTGGVGALFDLSGNDSYSVTSVDSKGALLGVFGQGSTPGSALVDVGGGSDTYAADHDSSFDLDSQPACQPVQVQGAADGLLFDDGGTDEFRTHVTIDFPLEHAERLWQELLDLGVGTLICPGRGLGAYPGIYLLAQGSGGMLVEGTGKTSYAVEVEGFGAPWLNLFAQNGISDAAGDDIYSTNVRTAANQALTLEDQCKPSGLSGGIQPVFDCKEAAATVLVAGFPDITMAVQGSGWGFTNAQLEDMTGNDTYRSTVDLSSDISLADARSQPDPRASLFAMGQEPDWLEAQGAAALESSGLLIDHTGDDTYEVQWRGNTHASTTTAGADAQAPPPEVTSLEIHALFQIAQGSGFGEGAGDLLDLGGARDVFSTETLNRATADPDRDSAFTATGFWPFFQGAVTGSLVALGTDPQITSFPSRPTCVGSDPRGFGIWFNCPIPGEPELGQRAFDCVDDPVGPTIVQEPSTAPMADGAMPDLAFTPDSSTTFGPEVDQLAVGVELDDPTGAPIQDARIHFVLQQSYPEITNGLQIQCWRSLWEETGVSGSDGIATATLPLSLERFGLTNLEIYEYRVVATYGGVGGASGIFPRHAVQPLLYSG